MSIDLNNIRSSAKTQDDDDDLPEPEQVPEESGKAKFGEDGSIQFDDPVKLAVVVGLQQRIALLGDLCRFTMEASQEVETPDDLAQVLVSVIMQQADKDMETFREVAGLTPEELADAAKRARAFQATKAAQAKSKVEEEG